MDSTLTVTVDETLAGLRLDRALPPLLSGISRSRLQKLIAQGALLRNGAPSGKSAVLKEGDTLILTLPEPVEWPVEAEDIPLDIVFEDEHLLVVNKPKGMVVHPAPGHPTGTLVNALLFACQGRLSGVGGVIRPGIVHRIDKDTSGLLIVAKNDFAHRHLAGQIAAHSFLREYQAVVYGGFSQGQGSVKLPIGRAQSDRKKMAVTNKNSKPACTSYRLLEEYEGFSHLALTLSTGRTHQIRVHMAALGHPVAGDLLYGPKKCIAALGGQCLHAKKVGFVHPVTGESMLFESALPPYFTDFLNKLRPKRC